MNEQLSSAFYELSLKRSDADGRKAGLAQVKRDLEHKLSILNCRVRSMKRSEFRDAEYKSICADQVKIKAKIIEAQKKMHPITLELRNLYAEETALRIQANIMPKERACA